MFPENDLKDIILHNTAKSCVFIFCILIIVHAFEAIILRMDETIFGENFINKLFGLAVIWVVLRILRWEWHDIGFSTHGFAKEIFLGFSLSAITFLIAYAAECSILMRQGNTVRLGFFTTGFSLTGASVIHNGFGFIALCLFFNVVNVMMEEGTFRGLFYEILRTDHSSKTAMFLQAFLFGIWHVVTPLHNLIDGDIGVLSFFALSVGYVILAGMMGIKWSLMYRMTGSLYAGMADHFFNNCIATNLLHISTENGIDELMLVRVLIAQVLSFIIVAVIWAKKKHQSEDSKS